MSIIMLSPTIKKVNTLIKKHILLMKFKFPNEMEYLNGSEKW